MKTRIYIPSERPGLVSRPRLVGRLQDGLDCDLIMISAPAGFGKTTLLSEWIHRSQQPVRIAWFSLEGGDNDPVRFWAYFIAALKTLKPEAGETTLELLRSPQPLPIVSVLTPLINDLVDVYEDFFLVLDDYHFIQSQVIHDGVTFLLEHMPPRLHLILTTRMYPPLPLNRFRGKGTLFEIGADDLRFTLEEAIDLFKELNSPDIRVEDMEALNIRTEGWVVGLKMAALSMQKEKDMAAFITGFTGSQRYIMDYLIEEVLQQQPPEIQDFLLKTSVLERLNGGLCDAVTGNNKGREILISLEKSNLFVVPLDKSREWYRYEHLFSELLRHRLEIDLGEETVEELQRRASRWYEGNGFQENAIDHALRARDWKRALGLIVASKPISTYGGLTTYNWLHQIPHEVLLDHPFACSCYGWALTMIGQYHAAENFLDNLEKSITNNPQLNCSIAVIRTQIASSRLDPRTEEYARTALSLLSEDDDATRATVYFSLGGYLMHTRRYNEAEPLLTQTYKINQRTGGTTITSLATLALIAMQRGKLHQAEEMFRQAINMAKRHPFTAIAHEYLSIVYYMWNDLEAALTELERALALNPGGPSVLGPIYLYTVLVRLAQGDMEAAAEALEKADEIFVRDEANPQERGRVIGYHLALALEQGNDEAASRWLDKLSEYEDLFLCDVPTIAMHRQHKQWGEAIEERLDAEYERYRREGLQFYLIPVRIEQAVVSSNPEKALVFLDEALAMGRPEGFIRMFVDWGVTLVPLLRETISRGIEPEYAGRLLRIIEEEQLRPQRPASVSPETLSDRELEVLPLLAAGLSNRQIAARLFISTGTAKTHVHNILQKLQVSGRTQAIAHARKLKLL